MNHRSYTALLVWITVLMGAGCDDKKDTPFDSPKAEASSGDSVEKLVEGAAEKARATFVKGMTKKSCDVLTPARVAQTFDVPEKELKQLKVMGCIYSWKSKGSEKAETILEANLTLMRVHDTVEAAKTWFKNSTTNKTGQELKSEMKQVTDKTKEHEKVDTETKKKVVNQMGSLMAEAMKEGTTYESIPNIGDEAKVALRDGALWVRVGNLTFTANAYKGPPQPQPQLDRKDFKDLKKLTSQSMEAQRKWLEETHEERKKASIQLAKLVVDALR